MTLLSFRNPATESAYRLRSDAPSWRIIKSRTVDGTLVVRHLSGLDSDIDVDPSLIDLLVRGSQGIPRTVGNSQRAFAATVLLDVDRTYEWVVAIAREAETRCQRGYPGFRPQSPQLRRDAAQARHTAMLACADMAAAWKAAAIPNDLPLPAWLTYALEDLA